MCHGPAIPAFDASPLPSFAKKHFSNHLFHPLRLHEYVCTVHHWSVYECVQTAWMTASSTFARTASGEVDRIHVKNDYGGQRRLPRCPLPIATSCSRPRESRVADLDLPLPRFRTRSSCLGPCIFTANLSGKSQHTAETARHMTIRSYETFSATPYFDDRGPHGYATPITERVNVSSRTVLIVATSRSHSSHTPGQ